MNASSPMSSFGFGVPACGDQNCELDICNGPESHGVKKPWFMTLKPVLDPDKMMPPPVTLMKMDGWVLEKSDEKSKESGIFQYCPSMQWKKLLGIIEIQEGYCQNCCEAIPEEIVAAYTMHNWNMLQKYDAELKKYGSDPYGAETGLTDIKVYR